MLTTSGRYKDLYKGWPFGEPDSYQEYLRRFYGFYNQYPPANNARIAGMFGGQTIHVIRMHNSKINRKHNWRFLSDTNQSSTSEREKNGNLTDRWTNGIDISICIWVHHSLSQAKSFGSLCCPMFLIFLAILKLCYHQKINFYSLIYQQKNRFLTIWNPIGHKKPHFINNLNLFPTRSSR